MNNIPNRELDKTCKHRSKCTNIVATICGLVKYIKGCQIIEYNEITNNNYREYLVDIDLAEYF